MGFAEIPFAPQEKIVALTKEKKDALVRVNALVKDPEDAEKSLLNQGSGFFIEDGLILTNANSVLYSSKVWVEYNGEQYEAISLGHDLLTNLAVLKTKSKIEDFKFVSLANKKLPEIGTFLLSVSFKMGLNASPYLGMVTGHNIEYFGQIWPTTFVRSSLPSEGGDGGAPVFNLNGDLIGMMIVSLPEFRSSFLLPVRAIQRIKDDIVFTGKVNYAFVGIDVKIDSDDSGNDRVLVTQVQKDSPAEKAGIKPGDVLLAMGGFLISSREALLNAYFFSRPNEVLKIEVEREGKKYHYNVFVEEKELKPNAGDKTA